MSWVSQSIIGQTAITKKQKSIMGKNLSTSLGGDASALLLLGTTHSWACGQGGGATTIFGLPTLGGSYVQPTALNAAGQVTGFSTILYDAEEHGFLFTGGLTLDLGTLGGGASQGLALDGSGRVVGQSRDPDGDSHAALFATNTVTDLGTLGGFNSAATFINPSGLVAGEG